MDESDADAQSKPVAAQRHRRKSERASAPFGAQPLRTQRIPDAMHRFKHRAG